MANRYMRHHTVYLQALSKKFRRYFFCSISGLMSSVTCSAAFTSSPVYADGPVTWFTVAQDMRARAMKDASQVSSNSRNCTPIAAEIVLEDGQH